jgi:hypothetical protein
MREAENHKKIKIFLQFLSSVDNCNQDEWIQRLAMLSFVF